MPDKVTIEFSVDKCEITNVGKRKLQATYTVDMDHLPEPSDETMRIIQNAIDQYILDEMFKY